MKAMVFRQYGSPDVLHLEDTAKPQPKNNEVQIKVYATSINSWDLDLLKGTPLVNRTMTGLLKPNKIQIPGCDIAGRVESAGRNVTRFQLGDDVFGDLSRSGWGGFAEYVCAPETALMLKPTGITFEQASAMPQAGLLALQGLVDKGQIQAGQKVLINGASGGVGCFAVPIAKSIGTEVTGVCSAGKMDYVRSLGADDVIDYTQEDFTKQSQRYDLILDVQGSHSLFDYKRVLNPNGRYVMVGGTTPLANQVIFFGFLVSMIGGKQMGLLLHKANKGLASLVKLVESGTVTPVIDKTFPLIETVQAFNYFAAGRVKGKVVINVA